MEPSGLCSPHDVNRQIGIDNCRLVQEIIALSGGRERDLPTILAHVAKELEGERVLDVVRIQALEVRLDPLDHILVHACVRACVGE